MTLAEIRGVARMQKIMGAGLTNAENGAVEAGGGRGDDYYYEDFFGVRRQMGEE